MPVVTQHSHHAEHRNNSTCGRTEQCVENASRIYLDQLQSKRFLSLEKSGNMKLVGLEPTTYLLLVI